jgi:hypothetical protein
MKVTQETCRIIFFLFSFAFFEEQPRANQFNFNLNTSQMNEKLHFHFSWLRFLLVTTVLAITGNWGYAQTGYIYIHKNATNERDQDFTFNVTGPNGFSKSYNLNDAHPTFYVRDIGATANGGLYAIAGNTGTDYGVYYKPADATAWTQIPGFGGIRIDGGPGNAHIHANSSGQTFYFDGTTVTGLGSSNAIDVAFDKVNNRVFYVNSAGHAFYRNPTSGSWSQSSGIVTSRIDAAPNGLLISTGGTGNTLVIVSSFDGSSGVNLGAPTGGQVLDVAVDANGVIYASSNNIVFRYTGGYSAGGSWVAEPTSRLSVNITGGNAGQVWSSAGGNSASTPNSIWTRTPAGFWIDDESIRPSQNSNSVLIPVAAGSYNVNETANAAWSLGSIDVYDPTSNTTANSVTGTSTVDVASGEVVHLVYRNFLIQSFPVANDCSGPAYFENFGTGNNASLAGPLTGQTNYHHISDINQVMQDGYYFVGTTTSPSYGNYPDHTSGNGTGQMMVVNASYDKGEFFRRRFTGLLPNTSYSFSAWILSLNNAVIKPNVRFEVNNPTSNATLSTISTGDITSVGVWTQYQLQFTTTETTVDVVLRNNNVGGEGNDLALDDIRFGLAQPNQPVAAITAATCTTGGSIQITSPSGASLEYSINGTTYQSSPTFTNVAAGNYSLTARYTNSEGCTSGSTTVTVTAPSDCVPGYIYLHKRALNEEGSPNFTFNITGGPTWVSTITLSDESANAYAVPAGLGADASGGLWALAGTPGGGNYPIFYRPANSSTWTQMPGGAADIDGGAGNTRISQAAKTVWYYDGTSESNITYNLSPTVSKVSDNWVGTQYAVLENHEVYMKNINQTTWTKIPNLAAVDADAFPNLNVIAYHDYENVSIIVNTGSGNQSLGNPDGNPATWIIDIAVTSNGTIFAQDGRYIYKYNWNSSSWILEPESTSLSHITGGPGEQLWSHGYHIYSRATTGNYIADEMIRNNTVSNSSLIPVAPGTYTITEDPASGWNLNAIDLYQANASVSNKNIAARQITITVTQNEVVNVIFENQSVQETGISNDCSASASFIENFGTSTDYGPVLTGLTSFHKANGIYGPNHYAVISNTNLMGGAGGYAGNFTDHTGNANGAMLAVDGATERGTFYRRRFSGLIPGAQYTFAAWAMNVNVEGAPDLPNIGFEVYDPANGTLLNAGTSGNLVTPGEWKQTTFVFTAAQPVIDLVLRNNTVGTSGNDLAIDDISFGVAIPEPIATAMDATCDAGGSISITSPINDGYEYSIGGATYQSSPVFTNLAAGTYSVTARYKGGSCVSAAITVTVNPANCPGVCTTGTLSTYTINPASTMAANSLAANGGGLNLVYELTSGSPVTGLGNSFTVPLTYSDLNNTATGVDNQWSGFTSLTLDGKTYFVLQPKTDNNPGGIYTGLPARNQQQELYGNPDSNDNFFTTHLQNGDIDILGNFTFTFGNYPALPSGATIYQKELTLRQTGNLETNGLGYHQGGFWQKPVNQTEVHMALNSRTPEFAANAGQSYLYQYTAFSDGTSFPTNTTNNRGAGIAGSITICYDATLPVKLVNFQAVKEQNTSLLSWKTTEETNSKEFVVEHSTDGKNWSLLATIASKGESNKLETYSHTHSSPLNGENLYRLRMVDQDATFAYSKIVSLSFEKGLSVLLYPNPASHTLKLAIGSVGNWADIKDIKILDLKGNTVFSSNTIIGGDINVSQLSTGAYVVSVTDKDGQIHHAKFVLNK